MQKIVTFSLGLLMAAAVSVTTQQQSHAQFRGRASTMMSPNTSGFGGAVHWAERSTLGDYWARNQANMTPWHGDYYYLKTGQPTALVVPPTIRMQQNYSWGVSQNTMTPVYHQFGNAPGVGGGGMFQATPYWPSHTNQFGVYPVRGPW